MARRHVRILISLSLWRAEAFLIDGSGIIRYRMQTIFRVWEEDQPEYSKEGRTNETQLSVSAGQQFGSS